MGDLSLASILRKKEFQVRDWGSGRGKVGRGCGRGGLVVEKRGEGGRRQSN